MLLEELNAQFEPGDDEIMSDEDSAEDEDEVVMPEEPSDDDLVDDEDVAEEDLDEEELTNLDEVVAEEENAAGDESYDDSVDY